VIREPLFNQDNVSALLGHLRPGSFAHDLVTAASAASTKEDAADALAALLEKRMDEAREALNGDS
jgi:hypothetical protein